MGADFLKKQKTNPMIPKINDAIAVSMVFAENSLWRHNVILTISMLMAMQTKLMA